MKIFFKFILMIMLLGGFCYANNSVAEKIKTCIYTYDNSCFENLLKQYPNDIYVKYYYAHNLYITKRYGEARIILNQIVNSPNANISSKARTLLNKINNQISKINSANRMDSGNYYDELKDTSQWQKPYNIKVCILGSTGKENILKKAFKTWDDSLHKMVNFSYVKEEKDADITAQFIEQLDGQKAGVTAFKRYKLGSKFYFRKCNIYIALKNHMGGLVDNTTLLTTTLHEIGHAIGITSHSDNIADIMYYSTSTLQYGKISKRDVNTVQKIYR